MNKEICRKCHKAIGDAEYIRNTQQVGGFTPGTYHLECYQQHKKHTWIVVAIVALIAIVMIILIPVIIISLIS